MVRLLVDNSSAVYSWPELGDALERAGFAPDSNNSSNGKSGSSSEGDGADTIVGGSSSSSGDNWSHTIRTWVQDLLHKLEIQIIPIEALDSRRQVEAGSLCVRKTSNNVDLNRNWPFAWKQGSASDEQFGGPAPFSEPQSRLMKRLIDASPGRLLGYVNVHSGEWALYTPWDSKPAYGPGMPADMPDLVSKIGQLCECKAGPAGAVSGYLAFGSSMDYLYVHKKVPYPLTVEVYGGGGAGKLQPGEQNKPMASFPVVDVNNKPSTAGAAAATATDSNPVKRRALQQKGQQQQDDQQQQGQQFQPPIEPLQSRLKRMLKQRQQAQQGGCTVQTKHQQKHKQNKNLIMQMQKQKTTIKFHERHLLQHEHLGAHDQQQQPEQQPVQGLQHRVTRTLQQQLKQQWQKQKQDTNMHMQTQKQEQRFKWGRQLLQHEVTDNAAAAAATAMASTTAADGVVDATVGRVLLKDGFMHSHRLVELQRQALLQADDQQAQRALQNTSPLQDADLAGSQQPSAADAGSEEDFILNLVSVARPDQQSCFSLFNPTNEAVYRRVVADWLAAFLVMLRHMSDSEAMQQMVGGIATAATTAAQSRGM
eukprot:GHRR01014970.1.p1 GENE.GHRR01014970.1~~GHRR01014970.1.p1  ORF type:complete len:592 (+),score=216.05 GHRR01014970.1:1670-3445(+)